jgi:hypothetical protein
MEKQLERLKLALGRLEYVVESGEKHGRCAVCGLEHKSGARWLGELSLR